MTFILRRGTAAVLAGLCLSGAAAVAAPPATAHPLGNFTVNHHTGIILRPDRIDVTVVIDRAELAAAQETPDIDTDHDGAIRPSESAAYAHQACGKFAKQVHATVDNAPVRWNLTSSTFHRLPGEAGLKTSRLQCDLTAAADLRSPSDIQVRTAYDTRRVGWHEMTARGDGVPLADSTVPTHSATDELRHYPADPSASPLNQRSANLRIDPGRDGAAAEARQTFAASGPVGDALNKVTGTFNTLVGTRELTIPVGLMALLLAVVLGASHAAMPGHGKTIMAAYLAGRRGTPKDAVAVGATVTLTHTAGVLVLGLALPLATHLAGETVLTWLGMVSGLLVTGIGLWLLSNALRNRSTHHHGHHHHGHAHGHHHHDHGKGRENEAAEDPDESLPFAVPHSRPHHHDLDHSGSTALLTKKHTHHHTHPHPHPHPLPEPDPHTEPARPTRGGLIGMGIAGGLVPSPSALVVLLGAIALGRTAFGILLVIAYGLGMAATLTLAGLLLVRLRDRLEAGMRAADTTRWSRLRQLARYGPLGTSTLVLIVGIGLTARAATGPW